MSALKPCPFCNSTNVGTFDKAIYCVDCYAEGPSGRDEERCATLWNTRAPDWQDISTAPRDGTKVLVWGNIGLRPVVFIARYDGDRWAHSEEDVYRVKGWMPLPAPPKEVG